MRHAASYLRRMAWSIFMTIVTSLLLFVVTYVCSNFASNATLPFLSKQQTLSAHEAQIAQNVVKSESISDRMDHIGGLKLVKEEIRSQVLLPLKHPKIFFGSVKSLHPPRGILFHGPPGTGKTMLARAIAAEAGVPFLSLTLANLENKYFGESSKLLNATFSLGRKLQPCVLFFDEIDGMIRTRNDNDQSCVYGFKTEFLTHMDGITTKTNDSLVVIGCTNCADKLDPAIRRRLPKQYHIQLPTRRELADILELNLKDSSLDRSELESLVARMKDGCSGSDIADVVRTAWALRMMQHTSSAKFLERLEHLDTTAEDVERIVGALKYEHLVDALRSKGVHVAEDVADLTDEESPPPSL